MYQTVRHYLIDCTKYDEQRKEFNDEYYSDIYKYYYYKMDKIYNIKNEI